MSGQLTRIHARRAGDGSIRLDLATGLLAPRVVSTSADRAEIALVATHATLLGGDHITVDLAAQDGITLIVRDVAGTVAYHGRGRESRWDNRIRVTGGSRTIWHAEPLVLSDGADVHRDLSADVEDGSTLLLRDTVVLGRENQTGGALTCRTHIDHGGRPALREDLNLTAESTRLPGMTGGARVIDTALAIGACPEATTAATVFDLPVPGAMARDLTPAAHTSRVAKVWAAWTRGV